MMAAELSVINIMADASIAVRMECIAHIINAKIEDWDSGKTKIGVEPFQQELLDIAEKADGSYERWIDVGSVAVHPDNREKTGLLPIDVHDLLDMLVHIGWNWKKTWFSLVCEVPPNEVGEAWREWNMKLVQKSDGLLAPFTNKEVIDFLSARGSHTTAVVRCMKYGSNGLSSELCTDGKISKSKILEKQPSMQEPLDKGMKYTVLRWQLVMACPRLMEILARTGNASHGSERVQTALQACMRIHQLTKAHVDDSGKPKWDEIVKIASIGMPPGYKEKAKKYASFVEHWSGGVSGHILTELVEFESKLRVKRAISATDLYIISQLAMVFAPRYVVAMVKALLSAPANFVTNGFADLFTAQDYASLEQNGKNKDDAAEAQRLMEAAQSFMGAYAVAEPSRLQKLLADHDVRMIMHVHAKKIPTRQSFDSLLHISQQLYNDVALVHKELPKWSILEPLMCEQAARAGRASVGAVREVMMDGTISDTMMEEAGFAKGVTVFKKKFTENLWIIESIKEHLVVLKDLDKAPEQPSSNKGMGKTKKGKAKAPETVATRDVTRAEIISDWVVKVFPTVEEFPLDSTCPPTEDYDLQVDAWKGHIKAALIALFKEGSDSELKIVKKGGKMLVVVTKAVKDGHLSIVPLTTNILAAKDADEIGSSISLGPLFKHNGEDIHFFLRTYMRFTDAAKTKQTQAKGDFLVACWACMGRQTADPTEANAAWSSKTVSIDIRGDVHKQTVKIEIPIIVNTRSLKPDEEVVVLKRKRTIAEATEPAAKRKGCGKKSSKGR
jgi:hypothetical protein